MFASLLQLLFYTSCRHRGLSHFATFSACKARTRIVPPRPFDHHSSAHDTRAMLCVVVAIRRAVSSLYGFDTHVRGHLEAIVAHGHGRDARPEYRSRFSSSCHAVT